MLHNENSGRSMIEMLGVLAIIAVLSVAGIAGYGKAMQMWKLNKWTENFISMITEVQTAYLNQKSYGDTNGINLTSTFKSAGIIAEEILDENNQDILGNTVSIYTLTYSTYGVRLTFQHKLNPGKMSVDCCKKLLELSQQISGAWTAELSGGSLYRVCGPSAPQTYRASACADYSLTTAAEKCNACLTSSCKIIFLIDNNHF